MLVSHRFGARHIQKETAEDPQLLIRNKRGGFFYWQDNPSSKYHGLWVRRGGMLYKSIARVRPGVDAPIRKVTNYFWGFAVERGNDFHELFYMDPESDSLIYEMKNPGWFSLIFDGKAQFDQDEWGHFYDITENDGCLIVSYAKKSNEGIKYQWYCAIVGYTEYEAKKEWMKQDYSWDAKRQDPPFERSVYNAVRIKGRAVVFSVHNTKEEASRIAKSVVCRAGLIKDALQREARDFVSQHDQRIHTAETNIAHCAALFSVQSMVVRGENGAVEGMYAGIPWFTQFWLRDFALSANQLDVPVAKSICMRYCGELEERGSIGSCDNQCAPGADSELLFFLCVGRLIERKALSAEELKRITRSLTRFCDAQLSAKMRDGFVINGPKETWMDTQYGDDGRAGARIEIQALALRAFRLAAELSGNPAYRTREHELLRKVRMELWDGARIRDGLGDDAMRPNIFLAYLFYPDLFLRHEWETAFDAALSALWLTWGGLSTLPKTHPLFCGVDRAGEDPNQSYHHGNAWFFLNNSVALALARVNIKKFKPFISALLTASTQDILWNGILGNHSEVSSANYYEPRGCLAQTWSAATYADALEGMMKENF